MVLIGFYSFRNFVLSVDFFCAGNFSHVTVDKDCFRLKQNTRKKVTMTIVPSPNNQSPLNIQRSEKELHHSQNYTNQLQLLLDFYM